MRESLGVRLRVNKLERIYRDDLGVQFFKLTVVEDHRQTFARADAKMITTVGTNLQRFLELAFVEVRLAAVTLNEDILGFDYPLLGWNDLNLLTLFAKPGHRETGVIRSLRSGSSG